MKDPYEHLVPETNDDDKSILSSWFIFNKMYSVTLLTFLHFFIQILIFMGAIYNIFRDFDLDNILGSIIVWVVAIIFWRIFFEWTIIIFRIYEELHLIRKNQ